MTEEKTGLRVVTYNVHKCRGLDGRVNSARIVKVLKEINGDIVALQEVLSVEGSSPDLDQGRFISQELKLNYCAGTNRWLKGGAYGNAVLSRFPIVESKNFDITIHKREKRGCLRADVLTGTNHLLHIFNVHLGTNFLERRHQVRKLITSEILFNDELKGIRIVLGDFNEWTRGLTTRLLGSHFESVDVAKHLQRPRTYPGVLPLLHLDHIYFEKPFQLQRLKLHKTRTALVASDHLPLVADLLLTQPEEATLAKP